MDDEAQKISEMVRNGTYFSEARSWYQAIYIGPVSERTFFLIIAVLSLIVAAAAVSSVFSLMPLVDRPALMLKRDGGIDEFTPRIQEMKEPGQSLRNSIMRAILNRYVIAHEGYTVATYESSANFVRNQSNEAVYNRFSAGYTAANPSSPAATLGTGGARIVNVDAITLDTHKTPMQAIVHFSTETLDGETATKTSWTATIQYTYTDLDSSMVTNPDTHQKELQVQDPQLQVVSYELVQDQ